MVGRINGSAAAVLVLVLAMMSAHLVEGGWNNWSEYTACTTSCGAGTKTKTRACQSNYSSYGKISCHGSAEHTLPCNEHVPCPVDGGWSDWEVYGSCSASCGGGSKTRTRSCTYPAPAFGGADCIGYATETVGCNAYVPCPVDGRWSEWEVYGTCSASCGGGSKTRTRSCTTPFYGGANCIGYATETVDCNAYVPCPVDGGWSEWEVYGTCSVSCGKGSKTRTRSCTYPTPFYGGANCIGYATETADCNEHVPCPVDGGWSEWEVYGTCSASCGKGSKTRTRSCAYPIPAYGGANCVGYATETADCNEHVPCPVDGGWSEWEVYGTCSASCGKGSKTRTRSCTYPIPAYGGAGCIGYATEMADCNEHVPCPVDGGWSEWEIYGSCSASCGKGSKTRTRSCTYPIPAYGGANCVGYATENADCNEHVPCPVDGGWSEWEVYGTCSAPCGGGSKIRTRSCTYPAPAYGGANCVGYASETADCNVDVPCPVDGGWSDWEVYGSCSASCGGGSKTRTRSCTYPAPAYGGANCVGYASETADCNAHVPCAVDGGWSEWEVYESCSALCGGGSKTRTRSCTYPIPAYGGADCVGYASESTSCNENVHCAVAGGWTEWTYWASCSNTCGHGQNTRARTCTSPEPAYGGAVCIGGSTEYRDCKHKNPCPLDGGWSSWGKWTVCAGSCGNGRQARVRTCTSPIPLWGGARCQGKAYESQQCDNTGSRHCSHSGSGTTTGYPRY